MHYTFCLPSCCIPCTQQALDFKETPEDADDAEPDWITGNLSQPAAASLKPAAAGAGKPTQTSKQAPAAAARGKEAAKAKVKDLGSLQHAAACAVAASTKEQSCFCRP